jgi:hypothetical protein
MINTTLNLTTKRTPFEIIAHGLPARTIAQARIEAQHGGQGGTDPDMLGDVSPTFDSSVTKSILELTMKLELVMEVRSVTEGHRRMTHENLNQSGRVVNLEKFVKGAEVYFNKPSTVEAFGPLRRPGQNHKEDRRYVVPDSLQTPRFGEGATVSERSRNVYLKIGDEGLLCC